jgi:hypothetical protein
MPVKDQVKNLARTLLNSVRGPEQHASPADPIIVNSAARDKGVLHGNGPNKPDS